MCLQNALNQLRNSIKPNQYHGVIYSKKAPETNPLEISGTRLLLQNASRNKQLGKL